MARMPLTVAGWRARGFSPVAGGEGHRKGWEWGAMHGTTDVNYSNGNSESFNEGVRGYAERNRPSWRRWVAGRESR